MNTRVIFHSKRSKRLFMKIIKKKIEKNKIIYNCLEETIKLQNIFPLKTTFSVMNTVLCTNKEYDMAMADFIAEMSMYDWENLEINGLRKLSELIKKKLDNLSNLYEKLKKKNNKI